MTCTFCRILKGELDSSKLYEDENCCAFLDIHPVSAGHALIVPKRHVESYTDLTSLECSQIMIVGRLVAEHLKKALTNCEGVNLSLADGVCAGQEVPHVHLHVIPRKPGDGFGWKFPPGYSETSESRSNLNSIATQVRKSIEETND